jgi:hypothetical protein
MITLDAGFDCNYDSEITILHGTNITIHGNGAVLDAAHKGRFFNVKSGAALALDHLVLRRGFADVRTAHAPHPLFSPRKECR